MFKFINGGINMISQNSEKDLELERPCFFLESVSRLTSRWRLCLKDNSLTTAKFDHFGLNVYMDFLTLIYILLR